MSKVKDAPKVIDLYTAELAQKICEMLAVGDDYKKIANATGISIYAFTKKWRMEITEYSEMYEKARADRVEKNIKDMDDLSNSLPITIRNTTDPKKSMAYVRAAEVQLQTMTKTLSLRHSDYSDRAPKTFLILPGFGTATADKKLEIVATKLGKGELSAEDAVKLLPIIETQIKLVDIERLKQDLYKQLEELREIVFAKKKK